MLAQTGLGDILLIALQVADQKISYATRQEIRKLLEPDDQFSNS